MYDIFRDFLYREKPTHKKLHSYKELTINLPLLNCFKKLNRKILMFYFESIFQKFKKLSVQKFEIS